MTSPKTDTSMHQLHQIHTAMGERNLYDSVSYCNRCGMCAPVCPIYQILPRETTSPRGRNQLLRLWLEQKIKPSLADKTLLALLESCTLCGRCKQMCAGDIPTAEHVLEMRRMLRLSVLPSFLQSFLQLRGSHPFLFSLVARLGIFLRKVHLIQIMRTLRITRLSAFKWLARLDDLLPEQVVPLERKFFPVVKQAARFAVTPPACIYLPSLEAEWILPQLARDTYKLLPQPVLVWRHTASGLFEYVYGDLARSRRLLCRLIERHERTENGKLPLVTDSIDVYLFLTRAGQVLSGQPAWEERARRFAAQIRFVTDYLPATEKVPSRQRVQLECGALFERQGKPFTQARQILSTLFGKNFVQCSYTDTDIPAFGYGFTLHNRAAEIDFKTVAKIARTKTKSVFTLSGLAALEMNRLLKQFYPAAEAKHIVHAKR